MSPQPMEMPDYAAHDTEPEGYWRRNPVRRRAARIPSSPEPTITILAGSGTGLS
jgi:hypothetical protein